MNTRILAAMLIALGSTTVAAQAAPLTVSVTKPAGASISLSSNSFNWGSVTDASSANLASDDGPITVTGNIATTSTTGSGSVIVTAPANLTGSNNASNIIPISALSMVCSGGGNSGTNATPTYAPQQALSASTSCASWGAGAIVNVNFSLAMFLDDRSIPVDTYTSSGFAVVATAT